MNEYKELLKIKEEICKEAFENSKKDLRKNYSLIRNIINYFRDIELIFWLVFIDVWTNLDICDN